MAVSGGGPASQGPKEISLEGSYYVEILEGPSAGARRTIPLPRATIGRSPESHVCIPDPSVSSEHAEIVEVAGAMRLRDLGSRNGTVLEGRSIVDEPLESGDEFRVGRILLRFVDESAPVLEGAGDAGLRAATGAGEDELSAAGSGRTAGAGASAPAARDAVETLRVAGDAVPERRGGVALLVLSAVVLAASAGVFVWVRGTSAIEMDTAAAGSAAEAADDLLGEAAASLTDAERADAWITTPGLRASPDAKAPTAARLVLEDAPVGTARLALPVAVESMPVVSFRGLVAYSGAEAIAIRLRWLLRDGSGFPDALFAAAGLQPGDPGQVRMLEGTVCPRPRGASGIVIEVALAGRGATADVRDLALEPSTDRGAAHDGEYVRAEAGVVSFVRPTGAFFTDLGIAAVEPGARGAFEWFVSPESPSGEGSRGKGWIEGSEGGEVTFRALDSASVAVDAAGTRYEWGVPASLADAAGFAAYLPAAALDRTFVHLPDRADPVPRGGGEFREVSAVTIGSGAARVRVEFDAACDLRFEAAAAAARLVVRTPWRTEGGRAISGIRLATHFEREKSEAMQAVFEAREALQSGRPGAAYAAAARVEAGNPFDAGLRAEASRVRMEAEAAAREVLDGLVPDAETALLLGHRGRLEAALVRLVGAAAALSESPFDAHRSELEARLRSASEVARARDVETERARLDRLRRAAAEAGLEAVVRFLDEVTKVRADGTGGSAGTADGRGR